MVLYQYPELISFSGTCKNAGVEMTEEIRKAQILFQQNELAQAQSLLNVCIQQNPFDIQALLLHGKINYKLQKWGEAMNNYAAILEIEPENQEAKSGLEMAQNILGYFTPDMFNP